MHEDRITKVILEFIELVNTFDYIITPGIWWYFAVKIATPISIQLFRLLIIFVLAYFCKKCIKCIFKLYEFFTRIIFT